ncbi:MAG: hypothetical protein U0X76_12275 [Bacteroidia bacterium]
MKVTRYIIAVLLTGLVISSCKKPDEYPVVPSIDYKSMIVLHDANGYDGSIDVTIGLTDGDGDIGYYPRESGLNDPIFDDPSSEYYTNFKVETYHKIMGVWTLDTVDISARIPYLTPEGSNKALKCEVRRNLPIRPSLNLDTFYYKIFIYDRGLHQSNTITTPEVVLTSQ